jgi:glycosyltransferase involved in cell wall biosynthesis
MNQCDEIWTPSPLIAEWYRGPGGITVPVHVYEHGVDPVWEPKVRKVEDKFKFLHVGGEAVRKGGTEAMKGIRLAFPKNNDVELNMKLISEGWNIGQLGKVNIINRVMSLSELIDLFHENHVFVYPSYGEGFGLTPLQAMATGMPTIACPAWAPYAKYLDPNLSVSSKLVRSPWPALHPGNMLQPSLDDVVEHMRDAYDNYDLVHKRALDWVDTIVEAYDWDRLTKITFEALSERLENS